jgi:hypothetical protein
MKKHLLAIAVSLFSILALCQNTTTTFLDYDKVLYNLKDKGQSSSYFKKLDYDAMLLLDYNCLKDLLRVNPNFQEQYSIRLENYKLPIKSIYTKQYQLLFPTDIKGLFSDQKTFELFFQKTRLKNRGNYELSPNIYLKEPNKAVFTIFGNNWSETYRLILKNGLVTLEPISETIE